MSAAVGKCGALVPTVLFNYIGNATKFWVVCWAGLLGFFMTVMFIPDATGESIVDLITANMGLLGQGVSEIWKGRDPPPPQKLLLCTALTNTILTEMRQEKVACASDLQNTSDLCFDRLFTVTQM